MEHNELIPHLFRTEFGKITSVLGKLFGIGQLGIAEEIASETFLLAVETWPYNGIPPNPAAWLYVVAKNKAKNYLKRENTFNRSVAPQLTRPATQEFEEPDMSEQNISDSRLQMLFAICHPSIPVESQIGLALRILCGFGIDEIADAFLTNRETINKRLFRAKEKLRRERVKIEFPAGDEINKRLAAVLTTLYLFFNEGYYSESKGAVLRQDLCFEAMRLTELLLENELTDQPAANALLSLMCFHASRFKARKDENGAVVLYDDQDEALWDRSLIFKGGYFLHRATRGTIVSKYHLEAGIAYWHTIKADTKEKWENILQLFNRLLQIEYSAIAALNRTFAFARVHGKETAIHEAEKLNLKNNHFYYTLLGYLYTDIDNRKAKEHFESALALAKTASDKQTIQKKIDRLN